MTGGVYSELGCNLLILPCSSGTVQKEGHPSAAGGWQGMTYIREQFHSTTFIKGGN